MSAAALPPGMQVIERGWVSSNQIVFLEGESASVVDTGYGRHAAQTLALVEHVLGGRRLGRIVNTHTHSDHIGGNAALKRAYPNVRIHIPEGEAGVVRAWDAVALHLQPMGQECERFEFDATYGDGDCLRLGGLDWHAVASPGHDMESLMLWCESERILISADALWENGFGILFPALPPDQDRAGEIFAAQRATLDHIETLAPRLVIPGHGAPFTDVAGALARARGRLDHFAADPARNALNAAKVVLSFLLMIEGSIALDGLEGRIAALPMLAEINRGCLRHDLSAFTEWLVAGLEKSGAAHRADGWLRAGRAPG